MRWVRYFLIVCILLSSCHIEQNVSESMIKQSPIDNRDRRKALAIFVKKHFDTGDKTIREIAADLALAEYYMEIENER